MASVEVQTDLAVKTLTGKTITLCVESTDTVRVLKVPFGTPADTPTPFRLWCANRRSSKTRCICASSVSCTHSLLLRRESRRTSSDSFARAGRWVRL